MGYQGIYIYTYYIAIFPINIQIYLCTIVMFTYIDMYIFMIPITKLPYIYNYLQCI